MASYEIHECRFCGNRYEEDVNDKSHKLLSKYIHYLGICDVGCWNKIKQDHKNSIMFRAAILGDDRKRNKIPIVDRHKLS